MNKFRIQMLAGAICALLLQTACVEKKLDLAPAFRGTNTTASQRAIVTRLNAVLKDFAFDQNNNNNSALLPNSAQNTDASQLTDTTFRTGIYLVQAGCVDFLNSGNMETKLKIVKNQGNAKFDASLADAAMELFKRSTGLAPDVFPEIFAAARASYVAQIAEARAAALTQNETITSLCMSSVGAMYFLGI